MDLITILLAAALAIGTSTTTSGTSETRATIIDTGATSSAETPPGDTDETRATIIDTGAQSQ